ncbi:hypothetical protein P879_01063 [Paragonimus westermani]|uniref:Uncharacterized protein n=1 Tax=Paragonimus westermani TaxID=34504 RepID=A0A8T0DIP3_9TREM|nr:hypothetical protein P879_01063 [Paragonimus westermani]
MSTAPDGATRNLFPDRRRTLGPHCEECEGICWSEIAVAAADIFVQLPIQLPIFEASCHQTHSGMTVQIAKPQFTPALHFLVGYSQAMESSSRSSVSYSLTSVDATMLCVSNNSDSLQGYGGRRHLLLNKLTNLPAKMSRVQTGCLNFSLVSDPDARLI